MAPLVSVVVPFYNVESYISECLESLAAQTLSDIEVILVDDGSQDGSRRVAEEFAARDPRFVVVRQPNRGPGPARNEGLRWARGPYLAFADSDDVVPPEAYEVLVSSLERRKNGSDARPSSTVTVAVPRRPSRPSEMRPHVAVPRIAPTLNRAR